MNIQGTQTVAAPRAMVFAAICDPKVLLHVIPGCRDIERTSDTEYRGRIAIRLPGITGAYATTVRLLDAQAPVAGRLEGEIEGALGTIRGGATFRLSESESGSGTTISYDGHAVIGGPLARLDSRFVEGIVDSLVSQGLRNLEARLELDAVAAGPAVDAERREDEVPA